MTREDVRCFLEYLVDAGLSSSTVSNHLSAIRTVFDKMCCRQITLGLAMPRKPKRRPVVLSHEEVQRLLEAARSLRDKLCLGLMYAAGLRISEVAKLRYSDIDFDRGLINVYQGKGRADRAVTLPQNFRALLQRLQEQSQQSHLCFGAGAWQNTPDDSLSEVPRQPDFIFPSQVSFDVPFQSNQLQYAFSEDQTKSTGSEDRRSRRQRSRHISLRSIQRMMQRAVTLAGITKPASPHTLRHTFATHSFENGCDIRRIQKALGQVNLETTTIYVHIARPSEGNLPSPIDSLNCPGGPSGLCQHQAIVTQPSPHASATKLRPSASTALSQSSARPRNCSSPTKGEATGKLRLHLKPHYADSGKLQHCQVTIEVNNAPSRKDLGNSTHSQSSSTHQQRVFFTGIVASMDRPQYATLTIPPEEAWAHPLSLITREQRAKFSTSEFYAMLQSQIAIRYLKLASG